MGRPSNYKERYCEDIIKFFDIEHSRTIKVITTGKNDFRKEEEKEVANDLPHIVTFAKHIGVSVDSINDWANKYEEFGVALKEAKLINERMLASNALKGLYNPTFSIFMAKNKFGWRDEQHLKTNITDTREVNIKLDGLTAEELRNLIQASRKGLVPARADGASEVRPALDTNKVG